MMQAPFNHDRGFHSSSYHSGLTPSLWSSHATTPSASLPGWTPSLASMNTKEPTNFFEVSFGRDQSPVKASPSPVHANEWSPRVQTHPHPSSTAHPTVGGSPTLVSPSMTTSNIYRPTPTTSLPSVLAPIPVSSSSRRSSIDTAGHSSVSPSIEHKPVFVNSPTSSTTSSQGFQQHGASGNTGAKPKGAAAPKRVRKKSTSSNTEGEKAAQDRKEYLERNRIAALKSRQRKKERMGQLENEAKTYSLANADLQSFALTLHAEVMQLRALLAQLGGQHLPDVDGYLAREAEGGGIPTILAIAGTTLQTDYVRTLEA